MTDSGRIKKEKRAQKKRKGGIRERNEGRDGIGDARRRRKNGKRMREEKENERAGKSEGRRKEGVRIDK